MHADVAVVRLGYLTLLCLCVCVHACACVCVFEYGTNYGNLWDSPPHTSPLPFSILDK